MPSRSTTCPAIFLQCIFYSVSVRNNFFFVVDFRLTPLSISSTPISPDATAPLPKRQNIIRRKTL